MKNRSHPSNKNHGSSRSVSNRKNNRNCSFGFGTLFCLTVTITGFLIWSRMNFFTSLLEQTNQLETKPVVDIDKKLRSRDRDVDQKSSSKDIPIINHIHEATSIDNKKKITVDTDKKHSQEKSRKLKIAFAITMNHDGNFQDGAAVLAYSIYATNMTKRHDVSFVAFVHPNVVTSRPVLAKIGYHVIESPTPINASAITFDFLREKINKNGCCGASELIKLNSYRLTQYDLVIHMDADTFFINSIDELFVGDLSLIYTTDPNMATFKAPDKMPAQGGFLIIRPSMEDYKGLINTLMTTEFVIYHGWNHSQIGWFWGGMTVQGILPYYYNRITTPGRSLKIDRCVYNTMADVPECIEKKLDQVKSAHFTVCQKPWNCERGYYNPLCGELHREWFRLRYEAEKFYSLPPVEKACPKGGPKFYIPMDLSNAVVPTQNDIEGAFVPDVSPDLLLPAGNSGFIHNDYETIKREYTAFEFLK